MKAAIWVIVVVVLAIPSQAIADEADNFTCRNRVAKDAMGVLDTWINARIGEALDRTNRRGPAKCDASCLIRELQGTVGKSGPKATLVPQSRFVKWIKEQKGIERCHLAFRDTIYGARSYDQPWMWPFNGHIIFVSDSIRLSGRTVGMDKIDHFIREGLVHWRTAGRPGGSIASSVAHELGPPRRQFSWTEYGLKGWSLTGVLAYGDLAAGYFGYRFWSDLLTLNRPESFVAQDAATGRYAQRRPFTFAAYVNDAWDESINCSVFDRMLGPEVAAALQQRSMACARGHQPTLSDLPDARLYVNPVHLKTNN